MARIPTYTPQVSARTGRTAGGIPSPDASAEAFGAAIGRGLQSAGQGLSDLGTGFYIRDEKRREREVADAVAQADFTRRELELRNETGPDAAGYQERVLNEYEAWVSEQANGIEDDRTRQEFVRRMTSMRNGISSRAAQYELGTAAEYSNDQANRSLLALDNRVRLQPEMYDDLVAMGVDVINARDDVPAHVRARMVQAWGQSSARARFDGMMEGARTPDDLSRIERELRAPDSPWVDRLSPQHLDSILGSIGTARNAMRTQADATARAALDRLEARASDPTVLIPMDELRAAQSLASASENPVTAARMARIVSDQELVRQYRHSAPDEIEAAATPLSVDGLAPQDRRTLAEAGASFGLSLEYMTRVAGTGGAPVEFVGGAAGHGRPNDRITSVVSHAVQSVLGSGARVQITSGHRPGDRGSQHSVGGAADFAVFRADGSRVQWNDPEARAIAQAAASMGALGFGAGPTYMGGNHFHFDLGEGGETAPRRAGITVWSDDDGAGTSSGGPGAAEWYQDLVAAGRNPEAPRVEIGQDFIDRALATPGVRERLAGSETPERVVAAYAAVSREALTQALGRAPTDEELFIAHRHGAPEAASIITGYQSGDEAAAVRYAQEVQAYAQAGPRGGTTAAAYARQETLTDMAADARRRLDADPVSYAADTGTFDVRSLGDEDGFSARGEVVRQISDYYSVAMGDMQPFTAEEAAAFGRSFAEGSADDVLEILTAVQQMGPGVAAAAMRQIGDIHDVYGYAGGLNLETGQSAVASDIVRGQRRLEENPEIRRQIGGTEQDINEAFGAATGVALMSLAPAQAQSVYNAALAHYVETQVARGAAGRFDATRFEASVQAVMGAMQGAPAIDDVNGVRTVVPPGLSGDEIETAFRNMTVADWASMSEQGLPPRYITGGVVDPEDIADEATLRAIGGGKYQVALGDGSVLVTGRPAQNGRMEAFILVPTPERVRNVNAAAERASTERRATPEPTQYDAQFGAIGDAVRAATNDEDGLTHAEYRAIVQRYGAEAIDAYVEARGQ